MQPEIVVAIVVAVLIIAVLVFLAMRRKQESTALRERFGSEYDRAVDQRGGRRAAERELHEREQRRQRLDIRPLSAEVRERYVIAWRDTQRRFVDAPDVAVREAHILVTDVMRDRGYPMEDFEQRAADISVDHPQVVDDYRAADRTARDNDEARASTEDLRQAMVRFRALFARLLETDADAQTRDTGSRGTPDHR